MESDIKRILLNMEIHPVIILGAKEIGRMALEIFNSNDMLVYCLLDDDTKEHQKEYGAVVVMGSCDDEGFLKLIGKKCDAFVAVDNVKERRFLAEMLEDGRKVKPVSAMHKQVVLSTSAKMGDGNLINAGTIIGTQSVIGNYCIIQNRVVVDAFAEIQDFVQLSSGAIIGQGAVIEEGAFIGTGAVVVPGVRVGKNARVGAGSVVAANVKSGKTVFGNPASEVSL
jgi:sugar O-acyltransferase (sialic acid O-acetyltransferase NeuD family)